MLTLEEREIRMLTLEDEGDECVLILEEGDECVLTLEEGDEDANIRGVLVMWNIGVGVDPAVFGSQERSVSRCTLAGHFGGVLYNVHLHGQLGEGCFIMSTFTDN